MVSQICCVKMVLKSQTFWRFVILPHRVIQTAASEPKLLLAQSELCEDVMLVAVGPWALGALVRVTGQWECVFHIIRHLANQMKCSD